MARRCKLLCPQWRRTTRPWSAAYLRRWTKGNLDVIDELLSPDFVDHSLMPGQAGDREGYKRTTVELWAPFSHQRLTIEDQIAEGDKVFTRVTHHAIHDRGEVQGLAPTGEEWILTAMYVHRIAGGKIIEEWSEASVDPWLQRLEQEITERERVEQELKVARRIQQASLPNEVPQLEGWQITPYYQPAREVGGDFYDFHLLPEGRLGLVVGDATGKGVPAALVMSQLAACCKQFHKPWTPLRLGRYSLGSTIRCYLASQPTCL